MNKPIAVLLACLLASSALAQTIGGNASLSVTTSSSNVAIPAATSTYPALLIEPAYGTSAEVFYRFGADNTVAATTSSPALPSGGVCLNVGPAKYVAAITSTGSATVRLTQLTQCPQQVSGGSGGSSSSGGGGGVTASAVQGQVVIAVTGTAVQLPSNALTNGVAITAKTTNNVACGTIGGASVTNTVSGTGNGAIVCPGSGVSYAVNNSNLIYVNGTAGDIFSYFGN